MNSISNVKKKTKDEAKKVEAKVVNEVKMVGADARKVGDKITGEVKNVAKRVKDKI